MSAYFDLENWLYNEGGKDKPVEIKSAIVWGGLWIIEKWDVLIGMV